jgi:tRNA(Ile)-lysidine synthase
MDPYCLLPPDPDEPALPALDARTFAVLPGISALEQVPAVAVALSGGPDSMALCALLHETGRVKIHAITVDHALRPESAAEAQRVGDWVARHFSGIEHVILRRDPETILPARIQEQARHDRYELMTGYCRAQGIRALFLAHHQDDQAETFLFRLCKGSGLDGLAGMKAESGGDVRFIRPLLDIPKARLLATCAEKGLPFVSDPSNGNGKFARVRLRRVKEALAGEGLSAKRLAVTAQRLARGREALDHFARNVWDESCRSEEGGLVFDCAALARQPEDVRIRILMKALAHVAGDDGYGPRLERVEALARDIFDGEGFTRTTLHRCLIEKSTSDGALRFRKESA